MFLYITGLADLINMAKWRFQMNQVLRIEYFFKVIILYPIMWQPL